MIEAAGGVVVRRRADGRPEVLLVHRPRYDDWTFPKGKLEPGEDHRTAAIREVEEETGLRCTPGPEVAETRYRDGRGRPKRARYWLMDVVDGEFVPNDEVDGVRWTTVEDAAELLTYERDVSVLDAAGL